MTDTLDQPSADDVVPATVPDIAPEDERYNATPHPARRPARSLAYFWVRFDGEPTPVRARPVHDHRRVRRRQDRPAAVLRGVGAADRRRHRLRVLLRLVQGGTFTPLLWGLPVGHRMRMIGPRASSSCSRTTTGSTCSSARGPATRRSWLDDARDLLAAGPPRRAVFLNGVSHVRDLGYRDILETWQAAGEYPVTFVPDDLAAGRPAQRGLGRPGGPGRVDRRRRSSPTWACRPTTRSPTCAATRT